MRFTIALVDLGLSFDGDNFEKKALGGSETAMYYMAKHLAKLGHEVHVINRCQSPARYDGVHYHPVSSFGVLAKTKQFDIMISNRTGTVFTQNITVGLRIEWCHDLLARMDEFIKDLWCVDEVFLLSDFQIAHYNEARQGLPQGWLKPITYQTRNGVDLKLIKDSIKGVKKKRNKLIYCSRPERGLQTMLESIWPALLQQDPELELYLSTYDLPAHMNQEPYIGLYKMLNEMIAVTPNVHHLGNLSKEDLYQHIAESRLMIYPCHFPEISCIIAMESLACGTPIVTTEKFALTETCKAGSVLIPGMPREEEYQKAFVQSVLDLVNPKNDERYQALRTEGFAYAETLDWKYRAEEWDHHFHEYFNQRFNANKAGIYRQLMHDSDVVAAARLSERYRDEIVAVIGEEEADRAAVCLKNQGGTPERYSQEDDLAIAFRDWKESRRFAQAVKYIPEDAKSVLDVGVNVGMSIAWIDQECPQVEKIVGLDFSEELIQKCRTFTSKTCQRPGNVHLKHGDIKDFNEGPFDVVLCLETLEHIVDYKWMIGHLERLCAPGGTIILTVPYGPWESFYWWEPQKQTLRDHCHHFTMRDIQDLFSEKKGFEIDYLVSTGMTPRGEPLGNWLIRWKNNAKKETGDIDYEHKWMVTRPYQYITGHIIVRNEEDNITACLKSVAPQVDEIIVYDTGSTDKTCELAEWVFNGKVYPKIRVVKGTPLDDETGFAGARNRGLALTHPSTDWNLWFDADERLVNGPIVRMAVQGPLFLGLVIPQAHLVLDIKDVEPDTPIRLFRHNKGIEFYGLIHEHPELSLNQPIEPMLELPRVKFMHLGYPTEGIRREKLYKRNLPLLIADRKQNPDRLIGLVFLQRDYFNLAQWSAKDGISDNGLEYLRMIIRIYAEKFEGLELDDVKRKWWSHSFRYYQDALGMLGRYSESTMPDDPAHTAVPFQLLEVMGGSFGGFDEQAVRQQQPIKRWFRNHDEYTLYARRGMEALKKQMVSHLVGEYAKPPKLSELAELVK